MEYIIIGTVYLLCVYNALMILIVEMNFCKSWKEVFYGVIALIFSPITILLATFGGLKHFFKIRKPKEKKNDV